MLDIAMDTSAITQTFKPHVAHVTLSTPFPEILQAAALQDARDFSGAVRASDDLFPQNTRPFNLVTVYQEISRLVDLNAFLTDANRSLKDGGTLLIIDTVVPGTHLRGKKAKRIRAAGTYINAFLKLKNTRHQRAYSQNKWQYVLINNGFQVERMEIHRRFIDFSTWVAQSNLSPNDHIRLQAMLLQAPEKAWEFLTPQVSGDRIDFYLTEILILAKKTADTD